LIVSRRQTSPGNHISGGVLVGLAGRGILQSRTPWMHEQEADEQGLRLVYSLYDFTHRGWADGELGPLLDAAQRLGYAGLNITLPFKQTVMGMLDELDEVAASVGAVNTVSFRGGRRIGGNTDITGFAEAFRTGLAGADLDTVLQVGCGGAGAATANAMLGPLGVGRLVLFDADPGRAARLRDQLAYTHGADRVALCDDTAAGAAISTGIVNATPMGTAKFPGMPLPSAALKERHWVADVVYFPLETDLLAAARRKGCRTMNGSGMAVNQAADAFEIFTGRKADPARMAVSFAAFPAFPAFAASSAEEPE
jgi:shikimate dehydrogenase